MEVSDMGSLSLTALRRILLLTIALCMYGAATASSQAFPDTAYRLRPITSPIANTTAGQTAVAATTSTASASASVGAAPYTADQVAAGAQVYQQQCAACHGAKLQGVSAPALTGPSFGHSQPHLDQVRSVVATQMPLGAPGSLTPEQYASIMAYLLKYDCVRISAGGTEPFPPTNRAEFSKVIFGGRSCP
jgi:polar amino acid transport system substrate-binding protein